MAAGGPQHRIDIHPRREVKQIQLIGRLAMIFLYCITLTYYTRSLSRLSL